MFVTSDRDLDVTGRGKELENSQKEETRGGEVTHADEKRVRAYIL